MIGSMLVERRIFLSETSENFIRRDVMKSYGLVWAVFQPRFTRRLEQRKRPDEIRLDECRWSRDRAIDMRFSGKVNDCINGTLANYFIDQRAIGDVPFDKVVSRIVHHVREVFARAR